MTVLELIEKLQLQPAEKEVVIDNCDGTVSKLIQVGEITTDVEKCVFLEFAE